MLTGSVPTWINGALGILAFIFGLFLIKASRKAEIDCTVRDMESKKKFSTKNKDKIAKKESPTAIFFTVGIFYFKKKINI